MNAPRAARLVPPRPNPDPLPWPETSPWADAPVLAAIALVAAVIGGIAVLSLSRKKRPGIPPAVAPVPPDGLIERAERIRSALVVRFGESWAARTTEEIAGSPALIDHLGPERAGELVGYLRLADRAKFAPLAEPPTPDPSIYGDAWLGETLARLAG
ncbi:MAG: hypothetical protein U0800_28065 [Isosphaeraceae bacterium]